MLRKLREINGVKKVFIRSGIRYDYLMQDKSGEFFAELVKHHISGQLKVAPEHCVDTVLDYMGKPHIAAYEKFQEKYKRLNARYGKEQYLVPYLISSHPGCTLNDAVKLAEYLNKAGRQPEQVQDFYPTPGTLSTCMYYTGIDPRTMQPVYVAKSAHEKALQRALLQWKRPEKRRLVQEALKTAGRQDLIGFHKYCLVRPEAQGRCSRKVKRMPERQKRRKKQNKPAGKNRNGGCSGLPKQAGPDRWRLWGMKKMRPKRTHLLFTLFYLLKQSLQYTGRSLRGSKGTLQGFPHSAHTASYICRVLFSREYPLRASRQGLQRCGSFVKPFSA